MANVMHFETKKKAVAFFQDKIAKDDKWARKQGFKSYAAFVDDMNRRGGFGYLEDDEE